MGGNSKIILGDCTGRINSYPFDGNEGRVSHKMQSSSGAPIETFSHLTPEGSIMSSLITDQAKLKYHSSSPPQSGNNVDGEANSAAQLENVEDQPCSRLEQTSTQVSESEDNEVSKILIKPGVSINTRDFNKSCSVSSNGSDKSASDLIKHGPRCSQTNGCSHSHVMPTCSEWPMDSHGVKKPKRREDWSLDEKLTSGTQNIFSENKKELEAVYKSRLRKKELEVESLNQQLSTLRQERELLSKDSDREGDSYFEEIIALTTDLTGSQDKIGKIKVQLEGYEELRRRSTYLEEQTGGAMEQIMELQRKNAELKEQLSHLGEGNERRPSASASCHPVGSKFSDDERLQSMRKCYSEMKLEPNMLLKWNEEKTPALANANCHQDSMLQEGKEGGGDDGELVEFRAKVAHLEDTLEEKNGLVLKLKEKYETLVGSVAVPAGGEELVSTVNLALPPGHQPEVEIVQQQQQKQQQQQQGSMCDTETGKRLKAELKSLRDEVADRDAQLVKDQAKFEMAMVNYVRIVQHKKNVEQSFVEKEAEAEELKVKYIYLA